VEGDVEGAGGSLETTSHHDEFISEQTNAFPKLQKTKKQRKPTQVERQNSKTEAPSRVPGGYMNLRA
jgi:hypothetical protein